MPYINKGYTMWTGNLKSNGNPAFEKWDYYNMPDWVAVAVINVPKIPNVQEQCYQYVVFNKDNKQIINSSCTVTHTQAESGTTDYTSQYTLNSYSYSWQKVDMDTSPYAQWTNFTGHTNFPLYATLADFQNSKYYENGDYSDADNYGDLIGFKCDFNLNIIGEYRPNYSLSWTCPAVADNYISDSFCTVNVLFIGDSDTYNVIMPYNQGCFNFSFDKIISEIDVGLYNKLISIVTLNFNDLSGKFTIQCWLDTTELPTQSPDGVKSTDSVQVTVNGKAEYRDIINGNDGSTMTVAKNANDNENEGYDNSDKDSNSDNVTDGGGNGNDTTGILTRSYAVDRMVLDNIANKLWNQDFLDNIKLLNNNPIENIISCKLIPANFDHYISLPIMIGNVDMGISGDSLIDNGGLRRFVDSYLIAENYGNFLDYEPYTSVMVLLPRIGLCSLPVNMIMNRTINVDYVFDVITGMCKAIISVNTLKGEVVVSEYDGMAGIDIPVTSNNRTQQEIGFITGMVNAGIGMAERDIGSVVQGGIGAATSGFHSTTKGTSSASTSSYLKNNIVLYREYPVFQKSNKYGHTYGKPCQLSRKLNSLTGFTILNNSIDLTGLSCSETEKEMLRAILTSGFFIT